MYLAGVAAGSLATSLTDPKVYLAGASGGVYALIAAHIATIIMVSFFADEPNSFPQFTSDWCFDSASIVSSRQNAAFQRRYPFDLDWPPVHP